MSAAKTPGEEEHATGGRCFNPRFFFALIQMRKEKEVYTRVVEYGLGQYGTLLEAFPTSKNEQSFPNKCAVPY